MFHTFFADQYMSLSVAGFGTFVSLSVHVLHLKIKRQIYIKALHDCFFLSSNEFHCQIQVSVLADEILKNVEFDALRVVFNRFQSVVQFLPTISTILSPEVYESEKIVIYNMKKLITFGYCY